MFASKDIFLKSSGGYQISRSVRLRSSASAYFNRTPASAGNRKTWTWSAWVKRGIIGDGSLAFAGTLNTTTSIYILFTGEVIAVYGYNTSTLNVTWNVYLRDPSAWYHLVVAFDTTQATASNRVKLYINNQQITATITATYPGINTDWDMGNNTAQYLGRRSDGSYSLDAYLTEINYINGQALTPSSFGETNSVTGVWQPKRYAGTYGTNGFYLNFSDNSGVTATTIGKDYSGNGNNWTPNNISVTAGVTYDSMLDSPTPYADGGNGRGNYAVINPLDKSNGGNTPTMSNGNLSAAASANPTHFWSTIALPVGSTDGWYWEGICTSMDAVRTYIGMVDPTTTGASPGASYAFVDKAVLSNTGVYYNTASGTAGGSAGTFTSYAANDVVMVAYKNGKIWFGKNGTWMNSGDPAAGTGAVDASVATTKQWIPYFGYNSSWTANFGQRPFTYTPPTGFKALNTQNLPTPTISNGATVMAATTYTGTGAALTVSNAVNGVSFQPDLVWVKSRSTAENNFLFDSVRGSAPNYNYLSSNLTNAEATPGVSMLTAINSNGFTLGTNGGVNTNAATLVGWQWNAGGSTVTNTSGTISSQVRANATAGFSIVTYTGNGSAGATVGHGLGVAPSMVLVKSRSASATNWVTYHTSLGATKYILLNTTGAVVTDSTPWNNTAPTSSVLSLGTSSNTNGNTSTFVAYCFAAVAGYSAFGSYTGNGSADGPFVYLGFRPRWVMVKRTDSAGFNWIIGDSARNTYNVVTGRLLADSSIAEDTSDTWVDFTSNGFKIRSSNTNQNASGGTYIYAAFSEVGFKYALGR